jgi:hypothetical protein
LRTTAVMLLLATVQRADTVAANLTPQEPGLVKHVVSESAIEVLQKKRLRLLEIRLLPALIRSSAVCVTICVRVCIHRKALPY